jgi:hypothetical protein
MKTWIDSERQGRGRRFWFRTILQACSFHSARCERGYRAVWEGDTTVWVPFAKKMNDDIRDQLAGKDTK